MDERRATTLASDLQGGAGRAHKAANVDNALPPLRLVIQPAAENKTTEYVSELLQVAKFDAEPRRKRWRADDENFEKYIGCVFQKMRREYLDEAAETAKPMES